MTMDWKSKEDLDETLCGEIDLSPGALNYVYPNGKPPTSMTASDIAAKAADIIGGDRAKTHGDKLTNFTNIANLWNAWLDIRFGASGLAAPLNGSDVAKLMVLLKIARMESGKYNADDAIDACGYAAIAGELDA